MADGDLIITIAVSPENPVGDSINTARQQAEKNCRRHGRIVTGQPSITQVETWGGEPIPSGLIGLAFAFTTEAEVAA